MSDAPQGPGWWQASDGKWYPMGQSSLAPMVNHGPAVRRRARRSDGTGRYVVLLLVGLVVVAGVMYGPRYWPKVKEELGFAEEPSVPALAVPPGSAPSLGDPQAATPGGQLSVPPEAWTSFLAEFWPTLPEDQRVSMCEEMRLAPDIAVDQFLRGMRSVNSEVAPPDVSTVMSFFQQTCG